MECTIYYLACESFQYLENVQIAVEHYVVSHYDIISTPVASAPTNLTAVQEGVTSIRVSWSPSTPLGDTTGYRISYNDSDSSDSVDVSDDSTDNYLLTGLQNGERYTIFIVATSQHFHSESVFANMEVCLGENRMLSVIGVRVHKYIYGGGEHMSCK